MDTVILYVVVIVMIAFVILFFIAKAKEDSPKLVEIGADCRYSEKYKCADEILREMFFENPHEIAKQTQHEGTFYSLWESIRKYYYRQYKTNRIISVKTKDIVIETKYFSNHIFIVMYIPVPTPLRRIKPRSDIMSEDAYFIGMIIPEDNDDRARYITLKTEKRHKIVSVWTDDTIYTKFTTKSDFKMDSFKEILLGIVKLDKHSWNQTLPSYDGLPWMISLWEWADDNDISLYTLPRNKKKLLALEELNLSFIAINTLPKEVGNLLNLKDLSLTSCSLITLPVELSKLTKLETLSIVGNGIEFLPEELCMLENLKHIDTRMSALKQLPICMGKLNGLIIQTNEYNTKHRRLS